MWIDYGKVQFLTDFILTIRIIKIVIQSQYCRKSY